METSSKVRVEGAVIQAKLSFPSQDEEASEFHLLLPFLSLTSLIARGKDGLRRRRHLAATTLHCILSSTGAFVSLTSIPHNSTFLFPEKDVCVGRTCPSPENSSLSYVSPLRRRMRVHFHPNTFCAVKGVIMSLHSMAIFCPLVPIWLLVGDKRSFGDPLSFHQAFGKVSPSGRPKKKEAQSLSQKPPPPLALLTSRLSRACAAKGNSRRR